MPPRGTTRANILSAIDSFQRRSGISDRLLQHGSLQRPSLRRPSEARGVPAPVHPGAPELAVDTTRGLLPLSVGASVPTIINMIRAAIDAAAARDAVPIPVRTTSAWNAVPRPVKPDTQAAARLFPVTSPTSDLRVESPEDVAHGRAS